MKAGALGDQAELGHVHSVLMFALSGVELAGYI